MDVKDKAQRPDIAQFSMKNPEMQIEKPKQTVLTDLPVQQEYAQNTQTWE